MNPAGLYGSGNRTPPITACHHGDYKQTGQVDSQRDSRSGGQRPLRELMDSPLKRVIQTCEPRHVWGEKVPSSLVPVLTSLESGLSFRPNGVYASLDACCSGAEPDASGSI